MTLFLNLIVLHIGISLFSLVLLKMCYWRAWNDGEEIGDPLPLFVHFIPGVNLLVAGSSFLYATKIGLFLCNICKASYKKWKEAKTAFQKWYHPGSRKKNQN